MDIRNVGSLASDLQAQRNMASGVKPQDQEGEIGVPQDGTVLSGKGDVENTLMKAQLDSTRVAGQTKRRKLVQVEEPFEKAKTYVPSAKAKLVETETTVNNMKRLAVGVKLKENVLMEGPTGAGKTALVKYLGFLTRNEIRRINLSDMTDVAEIIGGFKPVRDPATGKQTYEWRDGIVVEAMRKGQWLLLDEINLANPDILERMNSLFDDDRYLVLSEKPDHEIVRPDPNFMIFATMNPASYSGRKELSDAMKNRLHMMWVDGLPAPEMVEIMKTIAKTNLPDETLLKMAMFNQTIADLAEHRQLGKRDGPYPFTLRDVLKWLTRIDQHKGDYPDITQVIYQEAQRVYVDRFQQKADRDLVEDTLQAVFGKKAIPGARQKDIKDRGDGTAQIGNAIIEKNPLGGPYVPGDDSKLIMTETGMQQLEKIANCVQNDEMVLLVGPTASGKTSYVRYLANIANTNIRRYNLSQQTDTTDFIGGTFPVPLIKARQDVELLTKAGGNESIDTIAAGVVVSRMEQKEINGEKWDLVQDANGQQGWVKEADFEPEGKPGFIWQDGILVNAMKPKAIRPTPLMTKTGGAEIRTLDPGTLLNYFMSKEIKTMDKDVAMLEETDKGLVSSGAKKGGKFYLTGDSNEIKGEKYVKVKFVDGKAGWIKPQDVTKGEGELWSFVQTDDKQKGWVKDQDIRADWIIFDEINLAEPSVLERINSLLDDDRSLVLTEKENERVQAHPSFKIFATMNPATARYAGRKELSLAMRNRFTEIWHDELKNPGEIGTITGFFMGKVPGGKDLATKMVSFQTELKDAVLKKQVGAKQRGGYVYTLRNLKYWSTYCKKLYGEEFEGLIQAKMQENLQATGLPKDQAQKQAMKKLYAMMKQLGEKESMWDVAESKFGQALKAEKIDVATMKQDAIKKVFIDGAMHCYADDMADPKDRQAVDALVKKHFEGTGRAAADIYAEWQKAGLI